jgi:hypothetical protein
VLALAQAFDGFVKLAQLAVHLGDLLAELGNFWARLARRSALGQFFSPLLLFMLCGFEFLYRLSRGKNTGGASGTRLPSIGHFTSPPAECSPNGC